MRFRKQETNLRQELDTLAQELEKVSQEYEDLKNEDQFQRNEKLEQEIKQIEKTYQKAVLVYENLLTLKEKTKKTVPLPDCGYYLGIIYFYLTEGCNLKCKHCWIAPKYQTEKNVWPSLDFELFKDIITQGKELGLSSVKLTGGEPLIHPDIDKILDHIRKEKLRLTIETNGIKCTPEIVGKIKKCKDPFVSVSIDGVNAETREMINSFISGELIVV